MSDRKKLPLRDQAQYLHDLRLRCRTRDAIGNKRDAAETFLRLDKEDLQALDCIVETIDLFATYGADRYVRDAISRQNRGRR